MCFGLIFKHFYRDIGHGIGVMHGNSFSYQRLGERRFSLIVAAHGVTISPKPPRQRRHSNAANAKKKDERKLVQFF